MTIQPQISVIIPLYNNKEHVTECINCVLEQSLQNIEVICVDAGSTDGTIEVVKKLALKDDRIKIFLSYKKTFGGLLNHGISISKGKYVTFISVGSIFEKDMLEKLNSLSQTNYIDMIQGSVKFYNKEPIILSEEIPIRKAFNIKRIPDFIRNFNSVECILFKRSFLIHKNLRFLEDDEISSVEYFFYESSLKAATITYTDYDGYTVEENVQYDLLLSQFSDMMINLTLINDTYNNSDKNVSSVLYDMIFNYIRDTFNDLSLDYDYNTSMCLNDLFNHVNSEYVRQKLNDEEKYFYFKYKSPLIFSRFCDNEVTC